MAFLLVLMVICGGKGTKRRNCRKISGIAPFVNAETAGMFGFESLLLSNLSWLIKPNPTLGIHVIKGVHCRMFCKLF